MSGEGRSTPVLQIENLSVHIPVWRGFLLRQAAGSLRLLDEVCFDLYPGEILAVVGESGCGKTSLAQAIVQLTRPTAGRVVYRGEDLVRLPEEALRGRRRKLQLLFQEARPALHPYMRAGEALAEALETGDAGERKKRSAELVSQVGLPAEVLAHTPAELTNEQCQRLNLARALAAEPEVILYDAPVHTGSAQSQAQMLHLLRELQQDLPLAILYLSREAALAYQFADRIGILYLGKLVELAERDELYQHALHPYTQALLAAIPALERTGAVNAARLQGDTPAPGKIPTGCRFHPRCRLAQPVCQEADPEWREHSPGHWVACHMV